MERAVIRPEIDGFRVVRVEVTLPSWVTTAGGGTTWKTTTRAPRSPASDRATRKASFDGSSKSVG
jgi:hypothetical protein